MSSVFLFDNLYTTEAKNNNSENESQTQELNLGIRSFTTDTIHKGYKQRAKEYD